MVGFANLWSVLQISDWPYKSLIGLSNHWPYNFMICSQPYKSAVPFYKSAVGFTSLQSALKICNRPYKSAVSFTVAVGSTNLQLALKLYSWPCQSTVGLTGLRCNRNIFVRTEL